MLRASYSAIAFWCAMTICGNAYAHRPTMSDGSAAQPAKAIEFKDVQISRVVYHEVTPQAPRVWITFEVSQPQKLRLQLGVPLIDRLRDYRPALALVGAGLPKVELPFELPGDSGGRVFDTQDSAPRTFHEPFTGTSSWILSEQDVELPAAGRYYVVAHDPSGKPGKLWVALGTKEDWGPKDFLELPRIIAEVRGFHELTAPKDPTSKPDQFRVICDFDTPGIERRMDRRQRQRHGRSLRRPVPHHGRGHSGVLRDLVPGKQRRVRIDPLSSRRHESRRI